MSFFANRQGINLDFCTVSSGLLNEFRHFTVFFLIIPDITRNFLGNNEKSGGIPLLTGKGTMPVEPFLHDFPIFCPNGIRNFKFDFQHSSYKNIPFLVGTL
jgi:hypothetical protein